MVTIIFGPRTDEQFKRMLEIASDIFAVWWPHQEVRYERSI